MKTFFLIYLTGFIISGILYRLLYMNKSFYQYRIDMINEAKKQINDAQVDFINDDNIIESDVTMAMFLSYIGLIHIIIAILGWIGYKMNKK